MPGDTIVLVVEVPWSTLDMDLGRKAALYAGAGIPEYRVVDLEASRVVVHAQAEADGYRAPSEVTFGEDLASAAIPGLRVPTGFLLN